MKESAKAFPYNLLEDANNIANQAFGDDYETTLRWLAIEHMHAERCGCSACLNLSEQHENEVALQFAPKEMGCDVPVFGIKVYSVPEKT